MSIKIIEKKDQHKLQQQKVKYSSKKNHFPKENLNLFDYINNRTPLRIGKIIPTGFSTIFRKQGFY